LLILPGRPLSTAAVYRRFDEMRLGEQSAIEREPDFGRWATLPALSLLPLLVNDLEPAAFAIDAQLGRLREDVEQNLSRTVRMSGSGSSLFSLFDTAEEAEAAARSVMERLRVNAVAAQMVPGGVNSHIGES
jgi:4-diphosphocytidyl-2-C-methyl-D-erythritol kinase